MEYPDWPWQKGLLVWFPLQRATSAPQRMLFPASLAGPAPQHTCMLSDCYVHVGAQPSLIDMYNGLIIWTTLSNRSRPHPTDIGNENLWGETRRGLLASPESVLRFDFSNSEANIQWAEGRVVEALPPPGARFFLS